uniref:NACHT domain-containing protein n=1 Tax=Neogobius melanostomus TaxID=47308 RepID=A0A8C6SNU5_9GOBI
MSCFHSPLINPKSIWEINLEETLGGLSKHELKKFKRLLMDQSEKKELVILRSELDTDLSKALIKAHGVHSISVTKRLLQELKKNDLVEKLMIYDPEEILKECNNNMKSELRERFEFLSEGVSSRKQMEFNDGYTELFITEGDSGQVNEEHEVRQMERDSRRSGQEKTVPCQNIFKGQRGKPIRAVLTKGVAGAGKTVLTQKFSLDWAEGRENQDVELLFHFTFRELNELRGLKLSLVELLHRCFSQTKDLFSFNGLQLLFIFDGLDECSPPLDFSINTKSLTEPTESASVEELLVNLIRRNLLRSARLWITTRPAAANQIPAKCVSMVTEVRGFTDEQKEQYFRKRFTDEATAVISHIKTSRSLFIMCHLPVICWIISDVLLHLINKMTKDLPTTLTEMYVHFLVVQVKVKNKKYEGQEESDDPWTEETREMVKSLGKLAFEKLLNGKLIFSQSDLSECGLKAEEIGQSGVFTQVFREQPGQGLKKVYCFIHLSVQEFLAALHVHQTFYSSGKNLVSPPHSSKSPETFYRSAVKQALQSPNGHLDLFLRFLLGLSLPTNQRLLEGLLTETGSDQTNDSTVWYIKRKLDERGVSAERSLNLLHCLNELNDRSLVKEIQWVMREGRLHSYMSPALWSALSFLLLSSDSDLEHFDLRKYKPSKKALLGLLP